MPVSCKHSFPKKLQFQALIQLAAEVASLATLKLSQSYQN